MRAITKENAAQSTPPTLASAIDRLGDDFARARKSIGRVKKRSIHKKACVALARVLAVIPHRMPITGEAFRLPEERRRKNEYDPLTVENIPAVR